MDTSTTAAKTRAKYILEGRLRNMTLQELLSYSFSLPCRSPLEVELTMRLECIEPREPTRPKYRKGAIGG